jgi:hypothetical protein
MSVVPRNGPTSAPMAPVAPIRRQAAVVSRQTRAQSLVTGTTAINIDTSARLSSALAPLSRRRPERRRGRSSRATLASSSGSRLPATGGEPCPGRPRSRGPGLEHDLLDFACRASRSTCSAAAGCGCGRRWLATRGARQSPARHRLVVSLRGDERASTGVVNTVGRR